MCVLCTAPERLQVCREMAKYKVEILGISECRWTGSGEVRNPSADTSPPKISIPPGAANISIPFSVVTRMWQKAEHLLATPGSIGKPIGTYFSDSNTHLVASASKPSQPHFVYAHDTGRVTCEQCPSFND